MDLERRIKGRYLMFFSKLSLIFRKNKKIIRKIPDPSALFQMATNNFFQNPTCKPPKLQTLENFLRRKNLEKIIFSLQNDKDCNVDDFTKSDHYQQHMKLLELATVELVKEVSHDHNDIYPEININLEKGWIKSMITYTFDSKLSPEDLSWLFGNMKNFKCILSKFGAKVEMIHNLGSDHRKNDRDQVSFMAYLPEKLKNNSREIPKNPNQLII